jgi:hypothetical protein
MGKKSKRRQPAALATSDVQDDDRLKLGDRVLLTKLKSEAYNGIVGNVISLPKLNGDDGRYGICIENKSAPILFAGSTGS